MEGIKDTEFTITAPEGSTQPRKKYTNSSVYLNLDSIGYNKKISVSILDENGTENLTYKTKKFDVIPGNKYELYNLVKEKGKKGCLLYFFNIPKGLIISGKWSPDYVKEQGVITLDGRSEVFQEPPINPNFLAQSFPSHRHYNSRLQIQSKKPIVTFYSFTDNYRVILKEKDKSFYNLNVTEKDNYDWVINKYTGNDYTYLNNYLMFGKVEKYTEKELRSWTYCLHSSLHCVKSNVKNGTVVYRGVSFPPPKEWYYNKEPFYFGGFTSTTLNPERAKEFALNENTGDIGYILIITITNNNPEHYYCRDVQEFSEFQDEKEILISAFCQFVVTKIENGGRIIHLTCIGY